MEDIELGLLCENVVYAIGENQAAQSALLEYIHASCEASKAKTARLLATKFVADEAVGLVKELERALKNIAGFDHFISEEKARGVFIANVYPAIAKAAQFTAAIAPTAPTVGGETETQIFPPVEPE